MRKILYTILLFASLRCSAGIFSATNIIAWSEGFNVGVPGGIPTTRNNIIDVTQPPFNADNTGVSDATPNINSAINTANPNDIVYLPAGTYKCNSSIHIGFNKNGITLRGAGSNLTTIVSFAPDVGISQGVAGDYTWSFPSSGNIITGGLTSGSTNLTIGNTGPFTVGDIAQLSFQDDPSFPEIHVAAFQYNYFNKPNARQKVRILSKTGTTLQIFPPLYMDYSGRNAGVYDAVLQCSSNGIENLNLEMTNALAFAGIELEQCYACWIKNVSVQHANNYNIFLYDTLQCEVRHCGLYHTRGILQSNHSGLIHNTCSGSLIEDNILFDSFPGIEINQGSSGNAFIYNFIYNTNQSDGIFENHGPHNRFNLFEGNVVNTDCKSDGYTGGVSQDTLFRNWFLGQYTGSSHASNDFGFAVVENRFSRYIQLVGNVVGFSGATIGTNQGVVLGNPNIGNGLFVGFGPPWPDAYTNGGAALSISGTTATSSGSLLFNSTEIFGTDNGAGNQYLWALAYTNASGTFTMNNIVGFIDSRHVTLGIADSVTNSLFFITPQQGGWQALDTGVNATINRLGNYNYHDNGIPAGESLGTNIMPDSLIYSNKPSYFGNLAWPPFNSTNSGATIALTFNTIPAGLRFFTGNDPTNGPGIVYGVVLTPLH